MPETDPRAGRFPVAIADAGQLEETTGVVVGNEALVRALLDTVPVLMWSANPDGELSYLNRQCVDYTGHNWNGIADISPDATLTGSRAVNDPSGSNVAQIAISGSASAGANGLPSMPAFGDAFSNQEIADVTNYVTARFGAKGSSVTEKDVQNLRRQSAQ